MAEVRGPRIPEALQQVFLASNRGKEVNKPPPGGIALKVYRRQWFWQKKKSSITPKDCLRVPSTHTALSSLSSRKGKRDKDKSNKKKEKSIHGDKEKKKKKMKHSSSDESPQIYLCAILESRGYSMEEFMSIDTAYHNTPTPLQEASYAGHIIDVVRRGDPEELKRMMLSGLSPNSCNQHGESLVHMACRRGEAECLNVLLECGATLQIADDYGRTPLYDACWSTEPNFEIVEAIMKEDIRMFNVLDGRKQAPLTYVRRDVWKPWKKFLLRKIDEYWPARDIEKEGPQKPPPLTQRKPNSRKIPVPKETLPLELASMVASGKMDPDEAVFLRHETEDDDGASSSMSDDDDEDDDSSSSESEFSFDEEEMAMILQTVGSPRPSMPFNWKS